MFPSERGPGGHPGKLTRALTVFGVAVSLGAGCAGKSALPNGGGDPSRSRPPTLRLAAPDLAAPLTEALPALDYPGDSVKVAVFERINRDRLNEGLNAVAWDDGASRVADTFCAQQVVERTRGHFLRDGIPPYARTGLAGVFGMQSENSVSWTTTGQEFKERLDSLALTGHEEMIAEKPPRDGHRRTILDPKATHVGVGYAAGNGRFQMSQEFMTRRLERLTLERIAEDPPVVRLEGRMLAPHRLEFVTVAIEPPPRELTREEANARSSYGYPQPGFALVPEGRRTIEVAGVGTRDAIRLRRGGEFSFSVTADSPGLWTIVFYAASRAAVRPTPGGLAVLRVEKAGEPGGAP